MVDNRVVEGGRSEREDLLAALHARQVLGEPAYDRELVGRLLDRVEQAVDVRIRRELSEQHGERTTTRDRRSLVLALGSIALGTPGTLAIGVTTDAPHHPGAGIIVAVAVEWVAIAAINLVYALRRRTDPRR